MKRGPKTPKHHNIYAENLVAEIWKEITEILPSDDFIDSQVIRAQEKMRDIIVREVHDVDDVSGW